MTGPVKSVAQLIRNLWTTLASSEPPARRPVPQVIVHDPEAKLPHDLDDPFFDRKVQSRMADVIAHANKKS